MGDAEVGFIKTREQTLNDELDLDQTLNVLCVLD